MSYAALTREDASPVKRWLQERRLRAAVSLVGREARRILDYGAGDGEVCARLALERPEAEILCFEPTPPLRLEAEARLGGAARVTLAGAEEDLPGAWADTALCLEVLEHLPPPEMERALAELHRCLAPGGRLICGVPIEVGPPAAAKGAFRRVRRPEAYDARASHIAAAVLGRPRADRPVELIYAGRSYHPFHLGFDHRRLLSTLSERFRIVKRVGSPFGTPLSLVNAELYIVAVKEPA